MFTFLYVISYTNTPTSCTTPTVCPLNCCQTNTRADSTYTRESSRHTHTMYCKHWHIPHHMHTHVENTHDTTPTHLPTHTLMCRGHTLLQWMSHHCTHERWCTHCLTMVLAYHCIIPQQSPSTPKTAMKLPVHKLTIAKTCTHMQPKWDTAHDTCNRQIKYRLQFQCLIRTYVRILVTTLEAHHMCMCVGVSRAVLLVLDLVTVDKLSHMTTSCIQNHLPHWSDSSDPSEQSCCPSHTCSWHRHL